MSSCHSRCAALRVTARFRAVLRPFFLFSARVKRGSRKFFVTSRHLQEPAN